MNKFDLQIPTRILFGKEQGTKFADHISGLADKVMIVIGGGSVERLGYMDDLVNSLNQNNVTTTIFRGIEPNPYAQTINKGAETAREFGADMLLAFGGGSVMDATKGMAALLYMDESDIWPFVLGEEKAGKLKGAIPFACIPTTAATASEVTPVSVISNPEVNGKSVIGGQFLRSTVSWLNPAFTAELPATVTRDGASDILSHVFENYFLGGNDSPIADRYSEGIIETVLETLPEVIKNPGDLNLRGQLLWSSTLALNGMQQAGRKPGEFVMHSMEHAISGFYPEIAHGRGLATLYPAYFRWLVDQDRAVDRFALLGRRIFKVDEQDDAKAAEQFISLFETWLQENELYQSLTDIGVHPDAFEHIANYAVATYGRGDELNALGSVTVDDIVRIFKDTERQRQSEIA